MGRKKMADERRKQIFIGLFNAIVKKGFTSCTITEISREAGMSRGILHYYFSNKQEMQLELMKSLGDTHYDQILALADSTNDVREKIKKIIEFHYLDESKPFHDTVGVWVEFWGQSPHDRKVQQAIRRNQARIRKLIAGLIDEGIDEGIFRHIDSLGAASVILGMIEGPTLQWSVNRKAMDFQQTAGCIEEFIFSTLEHPGEKDGQV